MRRILLIGALLALVLPTAATGRSRAPGDGALTVKDAFGKITMNVRGGVIGHCDQCTLTVRDPNPDDKFEEVVTGADRRRDIDNFVTVYGGKDVKFRYIGGKFQIKLSGSGIDLALIGKGQVTLVGNGKGLPDDGAYTVNGGAPQPLPPAGFPDAFTLGANATP